MQNYYKLFNYVVLKKSILLRSYNLKNTIK